ncbi:MAG: hypothetical protein ACXVHX_14375, partial [Solirubrobacteraceae bacterium]
ERRNFLLLSDFQASRQLLRSCFFSRRWTVTSSPATKTPTLASSVAASRVAGTSTAPGKLTIGVLLPAPGTWRLFLQMKLGGRVVTAPYTLKVAS